MGLPVIDVSNETFGPLRSRAISQATCERYGVVQTKLPESGEWAIVFPMHDTEGHLVAQKTRTQDKDFSWRGAKEVGFFGAQLWAPRSGRRITVTEGEIDALTMAEIDNCKWPVVSITRGSSGAAKEFAANIRYLESFDEVVICFDMDEPGRKAALECAKLLSPGKAKIMRLPLKDANEMLMAGRAGELKQAYWEAQPFRPDGIIAGDELWDEVSKNLEPGLGYPWAALDRRTYGQRKGEIVLWCGGTGMGKSEVLKEVQHHNAQHHQAKVGIISLEESLRTAALAQMSRVANRPLHLPGSAAEVDLRAAFEATLGTGRYLFYRHEGVIDPNTILEVIRHMVRGEKAEWILLDHVSILTGGDATQGDERKRIDELMTKLRSSVEELKCGAHIISHLVKRDNNSTPYEEGARISMDALRGSGTLKQIPNMIFAIEGNQTLEAPLKDRRLIRVIKNRFSGDTGPVENGCLQYSRETGRLTWLDADFDPAAVGEDEPVSW